MALIQALFLPVFMLIVLRLTSSIVNTRLIAITLDDELSSSVIGYSLLSWFIFLIIFLIMMGFVGATFAVSCHRIILLGENTLPNQWGLFWGRREWKFFLWVLVLAVPAFVVSGVLVTTVSSNWPVLEPLFIQFFKFSTLNRAVISLVNVLMIASFGLVLPAIAIGERASLKVAWKLAYGNILRLITVIAIPMLALEGLWRLYALVEVEGPVLTRVFQFLLIMLGAFEVIILSESYRKLAGPDHLKTTV